MIEIKRKKIIEIGDTVRLSKMAPDNLAIKRKQNCVVISIFKGCAYPYLVKNAYADTDTFKEEELELVTKESIVNSELLKGGEKK